MKNLLLMRHGDAHSASASNRRDHDRPLTSRGREKSLATAKYLAQMGMIPEIILTSSASRCLQTGETINQLASLSCEVRPLPELYQASPDTYLTVIRQLPDQWSTVLIIGHNPTIQEFAHAARKTGAMPGRFECAAIACIALAIQTWGAATLHSGDCRWFMTPGESGLLQKGELPGWE